MLSFCQTGPEIIDSCAAAIERAFAKGDGGPLLWKLMTTLAAAEPHTSYRTPLALEMMLLNLYEDIRLEANVVAAANDAAAHNAVAAPLSPPKPVRRKKASAKNELILVSDPSSTHS
jgi:hypothetical protein